MRRDHPWENTTVRRCKKIAYVSQTKTLNFFMRCKLDRGETTKLNIRLKHTQNYNEYLHLFY